MVGKLMESLQEYRTVMTYKQLDLTQTFSPLTGLCMTRMLKKQRKDSQFSMANSKLGLPVVSI